MSVLKLDTDTTSLFWDSIVPLEGTEYLFEFYWSSRESRWYLNIKNQSEDLLAGAIAIVVAPAVVPEIIQYRGLLQRYQVNGNVPPGRLYAVDMSGEDREIESSGDLGVRVPLLYVTSDDTLLTG